MVSLSVVVASKQKLLIKDDVAVPKGYKLNSNGVPYKKKKGATLYQLLKGIM